MNTQANTKSLKCRQFCWILIATVMVLSFCALSNDPRGDAENGRERLEPQSPVALQTLGQLPMRFEANQGQSDSHVDFLARGSGYTLFLTASEAVLALTSSVPQEDDVLAPPMKEPELATAAVMRMQLVGANSDSEALGLAPLAGRTHYLTGNDPSRWRTDVPIYSEVQYEDIYPGVDLVYYGQQGQLEYDFVVAPGVDPEVIALNFMGIDDLRINEQGDLLLGTDAGEITQRAPVVYQEINGLRRTVSGGYVLRDTQQVGFRLAGYDPAYPLMIDPVLTYASYLGGTAEDTGRAVAVDGAGNMYMTGWTWSTDFPIQGAVQPSLDMGYDAFVAKLDATGSTLLYATYIGGNGFDGCHDIAVDNAGNAYVTGFTNSPDFPTLFPNDASIGYIDAFVVKLDPSGSRLLYATYLGGSEGDWGIQIAVDEVGQIYVTGVTYSVDFPTTANAFQREPQGMNDGYVAKLDPATSTLVYGTYLGGSDDDYSLGLAVDANGLAYVTGETSSTDFPVEDALQSAPGSTGTCRYDNPAGLMSDPCRDAFVTKLNATGSALVYSTYLGGNNIDDGVSIVVDAAGYAYVAGYTNSTNFPTKNPLQASLAGESDAFVTKLDRDGSSLVYSTYLGGNSFDVANTLAVDGIGIVTILGVTRSTDFPAINAVQKTLVSGATCSQWNPPCLDAFVTELNPTASAKVYSTYLGGTDYDWTEDMARTDAGDVYIVGQTASSDFPTSQDAFQASYAGGRYDAFIARLSQVSLTPGRLAIYYGKPSEVNGANGDISQAVAAFAPYDVVVLGDTLELPQYDPNDPNRNNAVYDKACSQNSHTDHDNTVQIIRRLTQEYGTEVYGYVSIGGENTARVCTSSGPLPAPLTPAEIEHFVDLWKAMGVTGIFYDEAGYDFGTDRARQNAAVDHAHSQGLRVFINAFDPKDIFEPAVVGHVKYYAGQLYDQTSTIPMNPLGATTHLGPNDLALLESYQIVKEGNGSQGNFEDPSEWQDRADKMLVYHQQFGTRSASITTIDNTACGQFDQAKFDYAWWSSLLYGIDLMGWGEGADFSAAEEGNCNGHLPYYDRPEDRAATNPTRVNAESMGGGFAEPLVMHGLDLHSRTTTTGRIEVDSDTHSGHFIEGAGTVLPPPAGSCTIPRPDLLSWWPGEGNALDVVGAHNGQLRSAKSWFAPGVTGQAFSFDGYNDFISFDVGTALTGTGPFSVDAWVQTVDSYGVILQRRQADPDGSDGEWILSIGGLGGAFATDPGKVCWATYGDYTFGFNFCAGQPVNDGAFHHIAAVREADGTGKIYIDGVLAASQKLNAPRYLKALQVFAGADKRDDVHFLRGLVDEIGLYQRALSAAAVADLHSRGKCADADADSDGLGDAVDLQPAAFSAGFGDVSLGGSTTGAITNRGDRAWTILDEPDDPATTPLVEGVRILVSAGSQTAQITSVVGPDGSCSPPTTVDIDAVGSDFVFSCSSTHLQVNQGAIQATATEGGHTATVAVGAGGGVVFQRTEDNSLRMANAGNTELSGTIDGQTFDLVSTASLKVVEIDIKPGSKPNCFNNDGHGVIPVAILGSSALDVTKINPSTVELEGLKVKVAGKSGKYLAHNEEVNGDGFVDLVVQIQDVDGVFSVGNGVATLTGQMTDGTFIQGSDAICIVPSS